MGKTMFDSASLEPDDRNFEQQMADLNVPIEPLIKRGAGRPTKVQSDPEPKVQLEPVRLTDVTWIRKSIHSGKTALGEKISLTKYNISLGQVAVEKMSRTAEEEIDKLGFGVTPLNKGHALVIAVNDPMGFDVKKTKSGSIAVANKGVASKLLAAGLTCGRYRLDEQYGSFWTAVLGDE